MKHKVEEKTVVVMLLQRKTCHEPNPVRNKKKRAAKEKQYQKFPDALVSAKQ